MVAVVSGNGLGLFNTSFTQLGTSLWGQAGIGQSRESQYVNIATGNLVLQDWDEAISVRGFDATALRTYNSQGTVAGAGQDGFITGYERSLVLTGTLNNVNSTVTLQTGDGQSIVFKYSGTTNQYVTTDGDGANDTLVWSSGTGTWTYTEGSSRRQELYGSKAGTSDTPTSQAATVTGYLRRIRDLTSDGTTPAQYNVTYDTGGRVLEVLAVDGAGAAGDALIYTYDSGTGRLSSISTRENGTTKLQVSYGYDAYNRLAWIEHQLTTNLSTGGAGYDSATSTTPFRTTYAYVAPTDPNDLRVATVSTSDGVTIAYTYTGTKVTKIEQGGASDGSLQTVNFTYNTNSTDVTDASGRTWTYQYDAITKQLTAVLEPAVSGQRTATTYAYTTGSDAGGAGNVKSIEVARASTTLSRSDFEYDANGNLLKQWGRTNGASTTATLVVKAYNSANQVVSETVYTGLDTDGIGSGMPTGGLTTNFIYDAQNRLRFVVDATGAVRELTYGSSVVSTNTDIGQLSAERRYTGATYSGSYTETALNTWATTTQKASSQLTEYRYDAKGRVNSMVAYASLDASGNGTLTAYADVTWFSYDAHNLLLQKVLVRGATRALQPSSATDAGVAGGEVSTYLYDGMGRLLTVLQRDAATAQTGSGSTWDGATLLTQYAYLDATNQLRVTLDSGAVRTETRNKAGLLTSASEVGTVSLATVTRTSINYYDATGRLRASEDAAGGRTYFFYDAMGRLTAQVDAVGAVTAYAYDDLGRVQQTTQYATKVDTSGWLSSGSVAKDTLVFAAANPSPTTSQAWVPTDSANDRVTTRTYDALGRLLTETTASTAAAAQVTTYAYDGASRLTSITVNAVGGLAADARVTRMFYDDAGRLLATLDAAGYLTENSYDAGGRRIKSTGYATLTSSAYWTSGTLAQLKTNLASSGDEVTRYFYDAQGQVVAELAYAGGTASSATGYLTEYVYDAQANQRAVKAYAQLLTGLAGTETLATLKTAAGSTLRLTQRNFNGLGQLITEVNAESTVTRYSYDDAGRLVKTEWAQGASEVREDNRRYDVFGNLIGELGGEGSVQLVAGLSEAQLDTLYATYGTTHRYDLLGRRIETIDAQGNKTWYFYDAQSRLTFTVKGVANGATKNALGEVSETRYSAFGQVTDTLAYTGRITIAGTQTRADVQNALNVLTFVAASDTRRQFIFDRRGLLTSSLDAENVTSNYTYTAFGQLLQEQRAVSTSAAVTIQHAYDKRGLETSRVDALGIAGLARTTSQVFDAFGRVTSTTDGTGAVRTFAYDRLGRQVSRSQVVEGRTEAWGTAYDAFSRVVSQTDALGKVTTYSYDDAARKITITTPELIATITEHSRLGQALKVTNGAGETTTYAYDKDGQLLTITDGLGHVVRTNHYDAGQLTWTADAMGRRVDYSYDAVGRVLTRNEDAGSFAVGKLNLTTTYTYDAQGRQLSITDALNRTTVLAYDREGRLVMQAVDPTGLNLRTSYTWDAASRMLTQTEGVGTNNVTAITTAYTYDALGRRISEVKASGSLNLTTTYAYDSNDNLVKRTDASGNVSRYVYDQANRLRYTVDGANGLTETRYDADGRVCLTRAYVKPVVLDAQGAIQTITTHASDVIEYRVYDLDGRVRQVIDGAGNVKAFAYDGAGRVTVEKHYVAPITYANLAAAAASLQAGTATVAQIVAITPATANLDEFTTFAYDAAGRQLRRTDALGRVTRFVYDDSSKLVYTIDPLGAYTRNWYDAVGRQVATRRYATPLNPANVSDVTTVYDLDVQLANNASATDQGNYFVYDGVGQLRYTLDLYGSVTETTYDKAGRKVSTLRYAIQLLPDTTLIGKLFAGTALASFVAPVATSADQNTYFVYNELGQVRQVVDGMNFVTAYAYDAAGRLALEKKYLVAATISNALRDNLRAGAATANGLVSDLIAVTTTAGAADRMVSYAYDGAGRLVYTLTRVDSTQATVTERRYDAAGRVSAEVVYGVYVTYYTIPTQAQVGAAIAAAGGADPGKQRVTLSVYDGAGQLRFQIDDAGAVSQQVYDAAGRVVERWQYPVLNTAGPYTEAALATWASGQAASGRKASYIYNGADRLISATDALNQIESYGYDALGQRTSFTNKLGKIWTYSYDVAGRLTSETSPQVSVARYNTTTGLVEVSANTSIVTTMTYDALGNVLTRTENAGTAEARTTQYIYDSRGLQIQTIFPDAWEVNASGTLQATGSQATTQVGYDALGRAVVQRDVLGNYSYKAYNARGDLTYDVDAAGGVSAYIYNAFGEQTGLTRYATALTGTIVTAGAALDAGQIQGALTTSANDRILSTQYDARGNKTVVQQSSVAYLSATDIAGNTVGTGLSGTPISAYEYNAYGQLVKESVCLDPSATSDRQWALTFHYYDELGRRTQSVDAGGYVTNWTYDVLGQITSQTEYARAVSTVGLSTTSAPQAPAVGEEAIGYDRTVTWTYDALGRKTSETQLRRYATSVGGSLQGNSITTYGYDAADRVLTTTVDGVATRVTYDDLGRMTSVTESDRDIALGTAGATLQGSTGATLANVSLYDHVSPYTTTAYDAFGNAMEVRRYANGWKNGSAAADAARDQITTTRYDRQGRAVITWMVNGTDGSGTQVTYRAYDKADHVTRVWYTRAGSDVSRNHTVQTDLTYDAVGRQLTSITTRQFATGAPITDSSEAVRYNAFGEITSKAAIAANLGVAGLSLSFTYDNAGRMATSDADNGVLKTYAYNLAGVQVRESHQVKVDGTTVTTAVTSQILDNLGRVTRVLLPSNTLAASTPTLTRRYDRWGNVLEQIDPRGYSTQYVYNERNQVVREIRPTVAVLSEAGVQTWERPTYEYYYDLAGRLAGQRDANGHVQQTVYDAAGRVVQTLNALGQGSRQAYDAFGQNVLTQDALGYLTFRTYDRLGRVSAHGDYLANAAGTGRDITTLETYGLDADGNRFSVKNALDEIQRYDYDSRGQLVRSQSAMGVIRTYEYDAAGRKVREADATNFMTWTYAYSGRLLGHGDLGGATYSYVYDATTGQLTGESSNRQVNAAGTHSASLWWQLDAVLSGQTSLFSTTDTTQQNYNRSYTYYANGQVKQITDAASNSQTYKYEYDAAGNRTMEETNTVDGQGKIISVRTRATYDGHNRIVQVTSDDLTTGNRTLDVRYDYDAVGNRRRVTSQAGYGTAAVISAANRSAVIAAVIPAVSIKAGASASFTLSMADYFIDPERVALTYTVTQGDGVTALPSWLHSTYDAATGQMVFSADSTTAGQTIAVKIAASDGVSANVSQTFNVTTVSNTGPTLLAAGTSTYVVKQGQALNLSVDALDYFRDADIGDRLTLSLDSSLPTGLTSTVSPSAPDRLWLAGTPTTAGSYAVSVRATDASGAYAVKTITIQVVASAAPVGLSMPSRTLDIGYSFVIGKNLSQVFTDSNNDALRVTAKLSTSAELPSWMRLMYEPGGQPPRLSLAGTVPPSATAGTVYTVVLTAVDIDGNTVTSSVQLTLQTPPANTLPATSGLGDKTATAGTLWTYTLPANTFVDSNGDTVYYSGSQYQPEWSETVDIGGGVYVTVVNAESFPDLPTWLQFDRGTRTFTGTPPAPGDYLLSVRAFDGSGQPTNATFTLSIASAVTQTGPAVNVAQPDRELIRGMSLWGVQASFTDLNGDALTYGARLAGGGALPSWLHMDSQTGILTGTAPAGMAATNYAIELVATDSTGRVGVDSFNLNVVVSATPLTYASEGWYVYDAADRVTLVNGRLVNGQITIAGAGEANPAFEYSASWVSYGLGYDAMGRAVARYQLGDCDSSITVSQSVYSLRGQVQLVYQDRPLDYLVNGTTAYWGATVEQQNTYDAAGRLTDSRKYFTNSGNGPLGWLQRGEVYLYDADGRICSQVSYNRAKAWSPSQEGNQTLAFQSGTGAELSAGPLLYISTTTTNYDSLGRVSGSTYYQQRWSRDDSGVSGSANFTHTFTNSYEARETYLEKKVIGTSTKSEYKATTTTSMYDAFGRRIEVKDETTLKDYDTTLTRLRYFSYDAEGGILTRRDGELKDGLFKQNIPTYQNQHFVYANGHQLARHNEANQVDALSGLTAYDQGGSTFTAAVQPGDTLQGMAERIYGNASLWYVLAAANGLANDSELVAGTTIKAPNVSVSSNNAATFKPFNPADVIGPTQPSLPYIKPPPAAGCSAGMVIMAVVAVVVSVYSFGTLSEFFAPAFAGLGATAGAVATAASAGFVSGVASSVASQVLGKALGVVDHFSLRSAVGSGLVSALTAGLSAGVGQAAKVADAGKSWGDVWKATGKLPSASVGQFMKQGHWLKAAEMAVGNAVATGVGNGIAGASSFSWTGVAAGAVSNYIVGAGATGLDAKVPELLRGTGDFGQDLAYGMAGGVVSLHVRRAFGFNDPVNYGAIAADAFGNALGNAAVRGIQTAITNRRFNSLAKDLGYEFEKDGNGDLYTVESLRDPDGVVQLDAHGNPIQFRGYAKADALMSLATSGLSHDDLMTTARDPSFGMLTNAADGIAGFGDPSLWLKQGYVEIGELSPVDPVTGIARQAVPSVNAFTGTSRVSATELPSESRATANPNSTTDAILGYMVKSGVGVADFNESHPVLSSVFINTAQAVFTGGPTKTAVIGSIKGIAGDVFGEGIARMQAYVEPKLTNFLTSIGFDPKAAGVLASGGLLGGTFIIGGADDVLRSAKGVKGKVLEHPGSLMAPKRYDVDEYGKLSSGDLIGDGLENHHVPQKAVARDTVPGYPQDAKGVSGPAIRLEAAEHARISALQRANDVARRQMTPIQLMADDIKMLRSIGVPNDRLQSLIQMYRKKYGN